MSKERDKLRAKVVGGKKTFKKEIVKWGGEKYEVRQPSIKDRAGMRDKMTSVDGEVDVFGTLIWAMIKFTYIPGTDERLFEDGDYDELMSHPTGGLVDELSTAAARLLNVSTEVLEKNLEETVSDNSSSPSPKK